MDIKSNNNKELKFPDGFLWGTSMSAYQVEGGNMNDWSEWEKSPKRLKELMKKGKFSDDFICGRACDFYSRYESDLDLAKSLNTNTIRLSIEWSRIEPQKENYNVTELNHYKEILWTAKANGLATVVTLWHWTNPRWFRDEGGWKNKKAVEYYTKYVDLIVNELGGDIDYWVTLNEPTLHIVNGYLTGKWPPNKISLIGAYKTYRYLIKAHKNGYKKIHSHFPEAQVSIAMITNYVAPAHKWNLLEVVISKIFHYYTNALFLNKIRKYLDFIGCDYYFHDRIVWYPPFKLNRNKKVTDMGWEIYPKGIYHVLKFLAGYKKPIFILENGLADEHDSQRAYFITNHLKYVHQAMSEGVKVIGYLHWSLIDNFEWSHGWSPKFGLFAVNRETMERTPRPSAGVYAEICKNKKINVK